MISTLVAFLILWIQSPLQGQISAIKLTYKISVEAPEREKSDGLAGQTLFPDSVSVTYAASGDYVLVPHDKGFQSRTVYNSDSNLIYTFQEGSLFVTAIDAGFDLEESRGLTPKVELTNDTILINGAELLVVEVTWRTGKFKYFFKPDFLQIDPQLFEKYKYDQWGKYLSLSGALPVRIEKVVYGSYTIVYDLISHTHEKYDEKIFELPAMQEVEGLGSVLMKKKVFKLVGTN
ncbi:hypothetical protein [Pontibacter anaerobius]|uniref:GLPGLI family protein n=1 Tax=Pontibacter anaerobius TaxID=2993940 RepID=A0ABT3RDI5_9BACT|nr:hypothetical protein [Pontibacter anaerobius]MCX2739503.1 hypothetical protein [Pontibacter anaerobius]